MCLLSSWRRKGISGVQLEWSTVDNLNSISNIETSVSSDSLPHGQGKHLEQSRLGYLSKSNKGINRRKTTTLVAATPGRCSRDYPGLTAMHPGHASYTQLVHLLYIPFSFHVHHTIDIRVFFWEFCFIRSTKVNSHRKWEMDGDVEK